MIRHRQLHDIVIPLGSGSCRDNLELRLALRSIARYAVNCRNIYIVSDQPPSWLKNVIVINVPDRHQHNKDANIIDKLLAAANREDLTEKFIFWSDDQLALQEFHSGALLPVYNRRSRNSFDGNRIWHRRMRNTFDFLLNNNICIQWNWDSHLPVPINKKLFRQLISPIDYASEPGYCVNTLYFGLASTPPLLEQNLIKATFEQTATIKKLPDKLFCGYNDKGLNGNLQELLLEHFPEPSVYEQ